jgi:hypothetical protein
MDVPALYDKAGTDSERLEIRPRFRGAGILSRPNCGGYSEAILKESGNDFRPGGEFLSKRETPQRCDITPRVRLHIVSHFAPEIKPLKDRDLRAEKTALRSPRCSFLKTNMI